MADHLMKLTIAIPTYNRANHLKSRIEELLPQLTEDIEIYVSDNASQDDTAAVAARFASERVRYSRNEFNFERYSEFPQMH